MGKQAFHTGLRKTDALLDSSEKCVKHSARALIAKHEPFPTALAAASVVIATVMGIVVYFKKRKR